MTEPKQPRTAKPGALLSQWWTLGAIATDSRTSGRHTAVAWVIIDRFMQDKGNGRASIRYLERATGLSQHTIIKACRELVQWDYFTQHIGSGTRATEYTPKWLVLHPSTALASAEPLCSTVLDPCAALEAASAGPMCSESYLHTPADRPAVQEVEDGSDGAATPPPPAAGLSAASAGQAPQGSFEDFWSAYAHKQQRAKAKAAWAKLDPDAELSATITTEAGRWAAHYAEHEVEPRWRVLPHNWLAGENWLQDLPIVHKDSKSAAIANVRGKAKPTSKATPAKTKPATRTTARVTAADVVETGDVTELRFTATDATGLEHERIVVVQHYDAETQFAGQRQLTALVHAAGLEQISESSELLGRTVVLTNDGYAAPTTRPDDWPAWMDSDV